jgi:gluconokinase
MFSSPSLSPVVILLMGASGSGKTTVGQALAKRLAWRFWDADDFHDSANRDRMRRGIPLTDAERLPWLDRLRRLVLESLEKGESLVLACSALKRAYRRVLHVSPAVKVVYLKASASVLQERLSKRQRHFFNPALLQSQLFSLEEPRGALTLDASQSVDAGLKNKTSRSSRTRR